MWLNKKIEVYGVQERFGYLFIVVVGGCRC